MSHSIFNEFLSYLLQLLNVTVAIYLACHAFLSLRLIFLKFMPNANLNINVNKVRLTPFSFPESRPLLNRRGLSTCSRAQTKGQYFYSVNQLYSVVSSRTECRPIARPFLIYFSILHHIYMYLFLATEAV